MIFVGRLIESQKRVSYVLKIWKQIEKNPLLDEWVLSVVGYGKDEHFYHWLAKKYKLQRIRFEGQQNPKLYYRRATIMMSTSSYEGWPMVMMEAMPMGCCIMAFDSYDAVNDIISNGYNGFVIPDNNIEQYVKCLTDLMLNSEKHIELGSHAIETCQRFTMEKVASKWQELILKMSDEH